MATNFPGSLDAFTNPTSGDTLDNPPHDQQHADVNDAVEAIEAALLDGAPLHIDDANERVGIGTATPARTLEVQSSSGAVANFGSDASNAYITLTDSGTTSNTQVRVGAVGDEMRLYAGGSESVRINSSGNVGINDTSPSYTLDVDGDINATGDLRIGGTAIGEWTSYTPTLLFSTLGNGTLTGRYLRVNDLMFVQITLNVGSTTTIASGHRYSLPVGHDASPTAWVHAQSVFWDASTAKDYIGSAVSNDLGGNIRPYVFEVSASYVDDARSVSATVPFTFATGDFMATLAVYAA